jgi:hypothetical protein
LDVAALSPHLVVCSLCTAGPKTKVLDVESDEEQSGHYTASFIPDVEITYKFRIFGNLSGSPISIDFSCSPGAVSEDTIISNSIEKISDTVTRNGVIGGYECPAPRAIIINYCILKNN